MVGISYMEGSIFDHDVELEEQVLDSGAVVSCEGFWEEYQSILMVQIWRIVVMDRLPVV